MLCWGMKLFCYLDLNIIKTKPVMHHPTNAVPSDNKANLRMYIREHRLAVSILIIVFNPRKRKFLKEPLKIE